MAILEKSDMPKLIMLIRTNFENAYNFKTEEETRLFIDYWYDCLKEYPREVVYKAFDNAIRHSEFAPKIKNILDEAEKLTSADRKTDEELWAELTSVLYEVYDASRNLNSQYSEETRADGIKRIDKVWAELSDEIKGYVVNKSTLIEISELNDESRQYEKGRFLRRMPVVKESLKNRQASEQFLKLVGGSDLTCLIDFKGDRK